MWRAGGGAATATATAAGRAAASARSCRGRRVLVTATCPAALVRLLQLASCCEELVASGAIIVACTVDGLLLESRCTRF